jgi:integrase
MAPTQRQGRNSRAYAASSSSSSSSSATTTTSSSSGATREQGELDADDEDFIGNLIESNLFQAAQQVLESRVTESTRNTYNCYMRKFRNWLSTHCPTYLSNNEIVIPLPGEVILSYLASIQKNPQTNKLVSISALVSAQSAIADYYKSKKQTISDSILTEIQCFMAGHRRMVQAAKQSGNLPMFEGKRQITFTLFCAIATFSIVTQSARIGSLYPHLFTILCWNLFARSNSVATLRFHHFDWKEDCMLITIPRHKGDQEGNRVVPVHVYANPLNPELCPVLALAIHVFCIQYHRGTTDQWCLFDGGHIESKFSHWLQEALKSGNFSEDVLGGSASDLGTHSFR